MSKPDVYCPKERKWVPVWWCLGSLVQGKEQCPELIEAKVDFDKNKAEIRCEEMEKIDRWIDWLVAQGLINRKGEKFSILERFKQEAQETAIDLDKFCTLDEEDDIPTLLACHMATRLLGEVKTKNWEELANVLVGILRLPFETNEKVTLKTLESRGGA